MFKDYNFKGRNTEFYKLDTFLDDIFYADVGEEEQYIYNLSTGFTRCMIKNLFDGEVVHEMQDMI